MKAHHNTSETALENFYILVDYPFKELSSKHYTDKLSLRQNWQKKFKFL